jgi:GNAT superfamily N-acetyltransferase
MTSHTSDNETPFIRRYRPEDRPDVVRVIKSIYDAYNFLMDFEEFDRDLADVEGYYQDPGGEFWVAESGGVIEGAIGVVPRGGETCELRRLYVSMSHWGRGLGSALIGTVIAWAADHGYPRIVLWSDVLFERAHGLYLKHGFRATRETRAIDPVNPTSVERFFERA